MLPQCSHSHIDRDNFTRNILSRKTDPSDERVSALIEVEYNQVEPFAICFILRLVLSQFVWLSSPATGFGGFAVKQRRWTLSSNSRWLTRHIGRSVTLALCEVVGKFRSAACTHKLNLWETLAVNRSESKKVQPFTLHIRPTFRCAAFPRAPPRARAFPRGFI